MDELNALRRVMSTTIARWQNLVDTIPEELLDRPSTEGEWSAADCLRHMLFTERRFFGWRLKDLMEGLPELVPYDRYGTPRPEPEYHPMKLESMRTRPATQAIRPPNVQIPPAGVRGNSSWRGAEGT